MLAVRAPASHTLMCAEPARRSEPAPAETIVLLSGEKAAESTGPPVSKHVGVVPSTRAPGLGEPASQHRATVCSVLTQCVIHLPTDSLTYAYYYLEHYRPTVSFGLLCNQVKHGCDGKYIAIVSTET